MPRPSIPSTFRYSDTDIKNIINATGKLTKGRTPQKLKAAIELDVVTTLLSERRQLWDKLAPPPAVFKTISRAANRLLELLHVPIDGPPSVVPNIRQKLEGQGRAWALQWFASAEHENRVRIQELAKEREMPVAMASAAKAERLQQAKSRKAALDTVRNLHGGWPETDAVEWMTQGDGQTAQVYREDLALAEAVAGVQRIRTWADLAAKQIDHGPTFRFTAKQIQRIGTTRLVE